ncbi:rod shape-determining protein MreC [Metabacillus arenae]|uniref:Cell shape-determining protein MreC n=1 Tax=Metabacillus arenae TaxID=2771434 RepID=A0A926RXZ5_9BACI|nr:rod shape-determining protein MreC [Metabacillus arenae]MBD1381200.1 rod shape-determining protein MreC [Metabacillus arenae]
MPQFFLNKRLILLLVSIIILVALIGFSLRDDRELSWPEKFVKDSTGLFQTVFHRPAQSVAGFFENVGELKNTYEENKKLKARLEEQMQLESNLQDVLKENNSLKEELGRADSLRDYNPIYSNVIGRNPDRWYELVTIDKGSQHGVEEDDAVITSKGLIGKIKSASEFTSTVQLLSAPDRKNRISAEVQGKDGKNVFGLIEGYDKEAGALLLRRIESSAKVEKGQKVITSGKGGLFPKGLLIGEVTDVQPDSYGLTKMAFVKPAADYYDLEQVIVAKRTAPNVDTEAMFEEEDKS